MKSKAKYLVIVIICVVLAAVAWHFIIGNPVIFINNHKLASSVKSVDTEKVALNDVVPFEWDILYTFDPYQSKKEIEETIGFQSADVKENSVNEGMVHLLFVKDHRVVASVLGYRGNLGYSIEFPSKVTYAENARFTVSGSDGAVMLQYDSSDR